jgi:hypothetical protein
MIRSPRFELFRLEALPTSFLIVDGRQVLYETISYANPEEFTIAIANYVTIILRRDISITLTC